METKGKKLIYSLYTNFEDIGLGRFLETVVHTLFLRSHYSYVTQSQINRKKRQNHVISHKISTPLFPD